MSAEVPEQLADHLERLAKTQDKMFYRGVPLESFSKEQLIVIAGEGWVSYFGNLNLTHKQPR